MPLQVTERIQGLPLFAAGRDNRGMTISPLGPQDQMEVELSPSDNDISGGGGGPGGPHYDPHGNPEHDPDEIAALNANRMMTLLAIVWIVFLFTTLTLALESRWAHSQDWVSVRLPGTIYFDTLLLLLSCATMQFARVSIRERANERCARWIWATMGLGAAFIGGQALGWRELEGRGLHLNSNEGSFFLYLLTGAHAVHLVVGVVALACVSAFVLRMRHRVRQESAVSVAALYWIFMSGLWCYLLGLLLVTIQG